MNVGLFSLTQVIRDSVAFALGLATTLALLGVAASFAGKAYGQVGQGLPLAASGLAVIMGLNLLEVMNYESCIYLLAILFDCAKSSSACCVTRFR